MEWKPEFTLGVQELHRKKSTDFMAHTPLLPSESHCVPWCRKSAVSFVSWRRTYANQWVVGGSGPVTDTPWVLKPSSSNFYNCFYNFPRVRLLELSGNWNQPVGIFWNDLKRTLISRHCDLTGRRCSLGTRLFKSPPGISNVQPKLSITSRRDLDWLLCLVIIV